ncbi:Alcohol dehydrogenase GroES-like domain-containing protein [Cladophialophora immunda]|nr:Alcohol dehydrogenase GroES-like domain-containing protein [Cladophialophora immunda]
MKAARFHPTTKTVSVDEIPVPTAGDYDILVKVRSASLCHSDLMLLDGSRPIAHSNPVVMGHEGAGYVEAWGKNVKGFAKGDRIGFLYIKGCCFECKGCQLHNLNCTRGQGLLQGFDIDGMIAEYTTIDYRNAVLLPETISLDSASAFFCAGFTAFHAIEGCECREGDWIGIIGCGGLGLFGIKYAKAMGYRVIAVDINDTMLQTAKEAGADVAVNTLTQAEWLATVQQSTNGDPIPAVAVFSPAQAGYNTATRMIGLDGVLMVVGLPHDKVSFDASDLCRKLFRIKAANTGAPAELPRAVSFTAEHGITPRAEFYKIEDFPLMVDKMKSGGVTSRLTVLF